MALVDLIHNSNGSYTLNATDTPSGDITVEILVNVPNVFTKKYSSKNYFFWNAFSDGKIYVEVPVGKKLSINTGNMQSLFDSFYHSDSPDSNSFHITNPNSKGSSWAFPFSLENYRGWMMSINVFFNYVDDFSNVGICEHYTGSVSGLYIRSKNYPFANTIPYSTCSHPDLSSKSSFSFVTCAYDSNHAQCPYYASDSQIIASKSINGFMNENSIIYNLTVSMSLDAKYTYQIIRMSDNDVNYTMSVDYRTQDTDEEAIKVFEEIISSYQDGFKTVYDCTLTDNQNQKNSFILSLV
jgi:hypothetical protein